MSLGLSVCSIYYSIYVGCSIVQLHILHIRGYTFMADCLLCGCVVEKGKFHAGRGDRVRGVGKPRGGAHGAGRRGGAGRNPQKAISCNSEFNSN